MSLRYIAPMLSLSISNFLCGSTPGSPVNSENSSFPRPSCTFGDGANISRQASEVFASAGTPLGMLDTNRPVSRTGTPCAKPQSDLLDALETIAGMQAIDGHDRFNNLNERQYVGLVYRNKKIVDIIYSMILHDPALSAVHSNVRCTIANTMVLSIKQSLSAKPVIWDHFPPNLKKSIIDASPIFYTSEDGWSHVLEGWITLEQLASLAVPLEIGLPRASSRASLSVTVGTRRRCGGFPGE